MDIIIVDDTQTAIDALVKKLKNYPNVTVAGFANNGKDGLELWKHFQPDVIVSDIDMPIMDGIEMVKKIREIDGDTIILLTTGLTSPKN